MSKITAILEKFKSKYQSLWQLFLFILLSGVTTIVELLTFAILNFYIFAALKNIDFSWWLLDYHAATGGGLGGFLATSVSYIVAQAFNFMIHRKKTFEATNNVLFSALMYSIMIISIWFLQIWLGGVFMTAFRAPLGKTWGDLLAKALSMTLSFAIQFPMNKWVIMRKTEQTGK